MAVIVTGAGGFLGRHVVARLRAEGQKVIAIDDLSTPGSESRMLHGVRWRIADLTTDGAGINELSPAGILDEPTITEIWHLASPASPPLYKARQRDTLRLGGAVLDLLLATAERHGARLLFASSSEVYGDPSGLGSQAEDYCGNVSCVGPRSMYDEAKRYGEALCCAWHHEAGVDARIARIFNCYDEQTEVLTNSGFVRFADLRGEELFATLAADSMQIEFAPASEYVAAPFVGDLLHFSGTSYDLMVTPNHRMLVDRGDGPVIVQADQIHGRGSAAWRLIRGGAKWSGDAIVTHIIPAFKPTTGPASPERRIPMGDWCEFVGWFLSEGSAFICGKGRERRVVITQSKKVHPLNYNRISTLVRRMGFNPYLPKSKRDIFVSSRQLYEELERHTPFGSENKRIPRWMLGLALPYLERLYKSLMLGDGRADGQTYTSKSHGLADDVCELAIRLGHAASVRFDGSIWRVNIGLGSMAKRPRMGSSQPNNRNGEPTGEARVARVPYDGMVYDVTVPNHLLFVRRNGKTCWSGNTYGPGMARADGRVVSALIGAALSGEVFPLHAGGAQTRSFSYVSDTVDGLFHVMRDGRPATPVNVGSPHEMTIGALVEFVGEVLGVEIRTQVTPAQDEHDPSRRCPDLRRLRALGWTGPKVRLEDGIRATADWMRSTMPAR